MNNNIILNELIINKIKKIINEYKNTLKYKY